MKPKLKYTEYEEYPMKLHHFLRGVLMPLAFAVMVSLVYSHRADYATDIYLVPECGLCIFGILLILICEFGFIFYASYSYYAVQWFMLNSVVLSGYIFMYLHHIDYSPDLKIKLPDRVVDLPDIALIAIGFGVLGWLLFSCCIYIYYKRRKFLFVESKENKRMEKGNLKQQEIEFKPKFDRERMSRSDLKKHMNKRFDSVDGVVEEEKHVEADPYE